MVQYKLKRQIDQFIFYYVEYSYIQGKLYVQKLMHVSVEYFLFEFSILTNKSRILHLEKV